MILALAHTHRGESLATDEYGLALGLGPLSSFDRNPSAVVVLRGLLQKLPLEERSFNDEYANIEVTFKDFITYLWEWCKAYRLRDLEDQKRYEAFYGFLGFMLITLEALAESDKRRNESRSTTSAVFNYRDHDCRHVCGALISDPAIQQAIKVVYETHSDYTSRAKNTITDGLDDWRELDFDSLAFHRHGTTSIILRVRGEGQKLRALKLILFPFMRFQAIKRETSEYGIHYNPEIPKATPSKVAPLGEDMSEGISSGDLVYEQIDENQSGVVQVLASSERWILMKYIDGMTLAELMARPELLEAKIQTLNDYDSGNQTFSQILIQRLNRFTTDELTRAGLANRELVAHLGLDALLRIDRELSKKYPDRHKKNQLWERIPVVRKVMKLLRKKKAENRLGITGTVAWVWQYTMGNALFNAMSDLINLSSSATNTTDTPRQHCDLTPSNIIVNNSRDLSVTLIDLGRNYFYTQSITGRGSSDSGFVAPEIREGEPPDRLSDVYSVGQLLQYVGYRGVTPGEMVFDGYYDRTSLVARFLEDLIQEVPERRLAVFCSARSPDGVDYTKLKAIHNAEVKTVMAADRDGHGLVGNSAWEILNDLIHPWSRAVKRQWKLLRERKAIQPQAMDGRFYGYTRWLFLWSTLATVAGALILGCVIFWFFRDQGWPYGPETIELGQKATGNVNRIPIIDSWRVAGYRVPDKSNWPARLVGISYILTGAKYYQGLFSGLMPLQGRRSGFAGWRAISTEAMMRLQTITAAVLVATTVFLQARFWPIASAIGQTIIVFCNFIVWSFAARSIKEASNAGISTAGSPTSRIVGLEAFYEWIPSSAFYAAMVWAIGILIYVGVLHDIAVYAVGVAAINLCLFYTIKCGKGGRDIRIGLARGCIAAERLRIWHNDRSHEKSSVPADSRRHEHPEVPAQRQQELVHQLAPEELA